MGHAKMSRASSTGVPRRHRLTPEGQLFLLEANPNPQIAANEDFADSAEAAGVKYQPLIQQILNLGLSYRPQLLS